MLNLAFTFFKLGCIAFGGPLAHISLVEQEIVEKQKLISKEDFINFIGSVNLIPGPNSTQVVLLCGYVYKGFIGMLVTGLSFIIPAATITLALAIIYSNPQEIWWLQDFFAYLKYGIFPIIIFSVFTFIKKVNTAIDSTIIFILSALLSYFLNYDIIIILIMGLIGWGVHNSFAKLHEFLSVLIFTKFLVIGFTLFGGGMTLIAYIESQFVQSGLLASNQLLDAIAFGQFTPGPILTSATFVGYQINGITGAVFATIGIFLPSFILIPLLSRFISKKEKFTPFLSSVNAASVGVMTSVIIKMATQLFQNKYGFPLIALSAILTWKKFSPVSIIIISMGYGFILTMLLVD